MLLKLKNTQVAGNGAFIFKWPQQADWLVTNKSRGEGERKTEQRRRRKKNYSVWYQET